ncbi:MAG: LysM peptidoglycan-binding domain-containing protein [Candidatus Cloacimonetes bacterium]|nr:LysM peptidoglycan-binding domain-containing protein [Candidatus Cloacimonadota bacterium]
MKHIIKIALVLLILLPVLLSAKVNYLNEKEYKKLSKAEREVYWQQLTQSRTDLMTRKADAIARQEKANRRLEELRMQLGEVDKEHQMVYNDVLNYLKVDKNDAAKWSSVEKQIDYFNQKINDFNNLSDSELWQAKKDIYALRKEWNDYRKDNYARIPDFQDEMLLIENRMTRLESDLESKRPKYYEDTYSVVKGDFLSKIAGYHFIYNDPSLWGIIYRANRDQIKDPNILDPNMVLKIPRGKPNTWKVYKGECLWRIASYPEVYGSGLKWTQLYRANQDQIKDPDLIYPNQILEIPRD